MKLLVGLQLQVVLWNWHKNGKLTKPSSTRLFSWGEKTVQKVLVNSSFMARAFPSVTIQDYNSSWNHL